MTEKDKLEFGMLMQGLAEVFSPDKQLTEAFVVIYYEALKSFKIKDLRQAVNKVLLERVFNGMPKPAEIANCLRGEASDRATLAWNKIVTTIRRVGPYTSVDFGDPAIHACIEAMGGWPRICATEEDKLQWVQKEFAAQYKVMEGRPSRLTHVAGICEIANGANGYNAAIQMAFVTGGEIKQRLITYDENKISDKQDKASGEQRPPIGIE